MSQLVIHRERTRRHDRTRNYKVMVDGIPAARVANGETVAIEVRPGKHAVRISIDWCRSRPLEVVVGGDDAIHLACGSNVKPGLVLLYITFLRSSYVWLRPAHPEMPDHELATAT